MSEVGHGEGVLRVKDTHEEYEEFMRKVEATRRKRIEGPLQGMSREQLQVFVSHNSKRLEGARPHESYTTDDMIHGYHIGAPHQEDIDRYELAKKMLARMEVEKK